MTRVVVKDALSCLLSVVVIGSLTVPLDLGDIKGTQPARVCTGYTWIIFCVRQSNQSIVITVLIM